MAKKVSDHFKSYVNTNGPTVSTVSRKIIQCDGLYFKDIDGSGQLSPVNDWRLAPEERAAAYVKLLTLEEKLAQLFISDWRMGPKYPSPRLRGHVARPDESGILDDAMKDENGKAYAYRDTAGNYYGLGFGLRY